MNIISYIRIITFIIISVFVNVTYTFAQDDNTPTVRRIGNDRVPRVRVRTNSQELSKSSLTNRDSLFNTVSATNMENASWLRIIYRKIELDNPKNAVLYYPEMPTEDSKNLFYSIFRLINNNQIRAYEYLDAREVFTPKYQLKFSDFLEKFHINYTKNRGDNPSDYIVEDIDIPSNQVKSYYIKEAYYFDQSNSTLTREVIAICPILSELSDYGENITIPMFWIKYNDIKPFLGNEYVMLSSINNVRNYTLEDFFNLNLYSGDIVKTENLLNKSLNQLASSPDSIKSLQDKIENELSSFDKIINNEGISTDNAEYKPNKKSIDGNKKNSRDKRVKPTKSKSNSSKSVIRPSRSVRK